MSFYSLIRWSQKHHGRVSAKEVKRNVQEGASYRVEMPGHTVAGHCCMIAPPFATFLVACRGPIWSAPVDEGTELKGRGLQEYCMLRRAQACVAAGVGRLRTQMWWGPRVLVSEPQQLWDCTECQSSKDATNTTRLTSCAHPASGGPSACGIDCDEVVVCYILQIVGAPQNKLQLSLGAENEQGQMHC